MFTIAYWGQQVMFKYFLIFTAALVSGAVLNYFLAVFCRKRGFLTLKGIPLTGGLGSGLAFIFSSVLSIFILGLSFSKILPVIAAALLTLFFGVIDDIRELTVGQKFLAQSFCAALLIIFGIRTEIIYLGFWGNVLVSFFWIVGITNVFNLLDIMDGLAPGTVLIVSAAFLLVGSLIPDPSVLALSLVLCAISSGFLLFNFPPARVYLGNSGSHFFGILIASLALITHYASEENFFALFSPVMILGFPIMDTVLLVIFRVIKKRPVFKKSRDHVALRIGALGFSPRVTIAVMYILCFIFAVCGILLAVAGSIWSGFIVSAVFLFSIAIFIRLVKVENHG
ncbi:MAG: MraY family glycosyltransferase [Candidatus Omnitrophica bacterium]|nr:MraY family glycosyltransferase [Candidatus Omnitrophota bacterium]MDD5078098.1 MraY family glycosyltransferase [Candidatus Omnitrophota bacterium]